MFNNSIPLIGDRIHRYAYNFIVNEGIKPNKLFNRDDWQDILKAAYTNPETGYMYLIPSLKNDSATYYRRTGYKKALVLYNLARKCKGRVLSLIVEGLGMGNPRTKKIEKLVNKIIDSPLFKDITLLYNTQNDQYGKIHIHILCFWPANKLIPQKIKGFTLKSDVELSKGKYSDIPLRISLRKFVQYLRFPTDQRYRNKVEGAKMQAYADSFIHYVDQLENGWSYEDKGIKIRGERNFIKLQKSLTNEQLLEELAYFEQFQEQKRVYKESRSITLQKNPTNEENPDTHEEKPTSLENNLLYPFIFKNSPSGEEPKVLGESFNLLNTYPYTYKGTVFLGIPP